MKNTNLDITHETQTITIWRDGMPIIHLEVEGGVIRTHISIANREAVA